MYVRDTMWVYVILVGVLAIVLLHMYMSLRYQYDWIGGTIRKAIHKQHPMGISVTDQYPIPAVPYMDRFGAYTKVPRMKHNGY